MENPLRSQSTWEAAKLLPPMVGVVMTTDGKVMRDRIKAMLDRRGLSARSAGRKAGMSEASLGAYLRNPRQSLRDENLRALARVLGTTVGYLTGETPETGGADNLGTTVVAIHGKPSSDVMTLGSPLFEVPIVGIVEAGAFREMFDTDMQVAPTISAPADPEYPRSRLFAYTIQGDSMDRSEPPLRPGATIICVHPEEAPGLLANGKFVVVERIMSGGHLRELTVKQLEVFDDRYVLHPRSSNHVHKPLTIPRVEDPDDGTEIRIVGIVRDVRYRV